MLDQKRHPQRLPKMSEIQMWYGFSRFWMVLRRLDLCASFKNPNAVGIDHEERDISHCRRISQISMQRHQSSANLREPPEAA